MDSSVTLQAGAVRPATAPPAVHALAGRLPVTLQPHPNLLKYYLLSSLPFGPAVLFAACAMYFRYRTLRYDLADLGPAYSLKLVASLVLLGLGLLERAGKLGAAADEETRQRLQEEVDRLAGADGMGTLFKVICVTGKGISLPPFATPR